MPERRVPSPLGGHLRRHLVAYVALVGLVALSPLPSTAADLVTSADIANGAVTQPKLAPDSVVSGKIADQAVTGADIKNGTVGKADLAESAKGAKVVRYDVGTLDFRWHTVLATILPGS